MRYFVVGCAAFVAAHMVWSLVQWIRREIRGENELPPVAVPIEQERLDQAFVGMAGSVVLIAVGIVMDALVQLDIKSELGGAVGAAFVLLFGFVGGLVSWYWGAVGIVRLLFGSPDLRFHWKAKASYALAVVWPGCVLLLLAMGVIGGCFAGS
jgi:hypothetical protein